MSNRPPILLQVFILTLFSIFDPASKYTYIDTDGGIISQHSICKHKTTAFVATQVIFEGGLVLIGCLLAFMTRNLGSALGESKQLLFAMHNVALVALIVMLMECCLSIDQKSTYVIMAVGVFWATVFSSCAFVVPRLLQAHRNTLNGRGSLSRGGSSRSLNRGSSYHGSSSKFGSQSGSFYGQARSSFASIDNVSAALSIGGESQVEQKNQDLPKISDPHGVVFDEKHITRKEINQTKTKQGSAPLTERSTSSTKEVLFEDLSNSSDDQEGECDIEANGASDCAENNSNDEPRKTSGSH